LLNQGDIDKLEELKEAIQQSKDEQSRLEGRLEQLMKNLQEYKISSLEEGNEKIEEWNKQISEEEAKIEKNYQHLKETYEW
jgi:hypothetical protein